MNIGFDAKRAYHNGTGLGHYSRTLIGSLAEYFKANQYYLFNPKPSSKFKIAGENIHEILPQQFLHKLIGSAWRASWIKQDLERLNIGIYHGLSNEIPLNLAATAVKTVVTIHDLIFERFPEQYTKTDLEIYKKKFRYACLNADHIIAISEQTKEDIISFYGIEEKGISICYQSCNPIFSSTITIEAKNIIKKKYDLPEKYFLYVGSVIERKNLLNICKAIFLNRNDLRIPLVVIGEGRKYKQQVQDYLKKSGMENSVIFLSDNPLAKVSSSFLRAEDFPAIYQSALGMIYPSFFEGFGIPVLEALWSRIPVITSNTSCLPETGGEGACYISPESAEEIAEAMKKIYSDSSFAMALVEKGWEHAQKFTTERTSEIVMNVYKKL